MSKNFIDELIKAITSKGVGEGEGWPLLAPQITSYFDVDQALDMYMNIMKLHDGKSTPGEMGKLFVNPTNLRYFLSQNGIIGLKLSNALKIKEIAIDKRVKYIEILLEVLSTMTQSDPLVRDGKNIILDKAKLTNLIDQMHPFDIDAETKRLFVELNIDLFGYAWALYYSAFLAGGYEIHGPYEVILNGTRYSLVIRENLNMNPTWIRDADTGLEYVKLLLFYKNGTEFKLNYYNQPITETHNENLLKVAVFVNEKPVKDIDGIKNLDETVIRITQKNAAYVNSMDPMGQVRLGADIAFYQYGNIYKALRQEAKPQAAVDAVYKLVGDKFATKKDGNNFQSRTNDEWEKIYDPRTDYLGDILN